MSGAPPPPLLDELTRFPLNDAFSWSLLGMCLIPVAVAGIAIWDHLSNFRYPGVQTTCIRILLLAPVYSVCSWLMLAFVHYALWAECVRETYIAYAMYEFLALMIKWSGGQEHIVEMLGPNEPLACRTFPTRDCCIPYRFKKAINYVRYMRTVMTLTIFIKWIVVFIGAIYQSIPGSPEKDYMAARIFASCFETLALHILLIAYYLIKPLSPQGLKATWKFLIMKGLIGVTVTQDVIFTVLLYLNWIDHERNGYEPAERALAILCSVYIIEMIPVSFAMAYLYSPKSLARERTYRVVERDNDDVMESGGDMQGEVVSLEATRKRERSGGYEDGTITLADIATEKIIPEPPKFASKVVALLRVFQFWDVCALSLEEDKRANQAIMGLASQRRSHVASSTVEMMITPGTESSAPISDNYPPIQMMTAAKDQSTKW